MRRDLAKYRLERAKEEDAQIQLDYIGICFVDPFICLSSQLE